MRRYRRPLLPLALLALALAGCGDDAPGDTQPVAWQTGKPNPVVGRVRAAVVERPAPDRAVIEAHWTNRTQGTGCALELVLPEGVSLLEGEPETLLDGEQGEGQATWRVAFPSVGRPLDAVVRFCVETDEGMRSTEVAVRLTDG